MKRNFIILLIITILFTLHIPVFSEEISEVSSSKYYVDIEEVKAIGIMTGDENGNFNPFESVTRAEFAKIICSLDLGGQDYEVLVSSSPFSDVKPDHWAIGYISYAVDRGFMNGYPDKTFKPDESISLIEAVKVLVSLTGYDYKAVSEGGYPYGYYLTAKELGIIKNITIEMTEFILRDETACLLNNTLDVPYLEKTGVNDDGGIYTVNSNTTLLNFKFKLKRAIGRVLATDISAVGINEVLPENFINIGGVIIKTDINESRNYLGYNVRSVYYCDEDNDTNKLVSIIDNKTETVKVGNEDFISYKDNKLYYESNDAVESVLVSENADFILNGDNVEYYDGIFNINLGYYTFVKSGTSAAYDLVIVKSYEILNVYSTNPDTKIISDKYNFAKKLDLSDEEKIYIIKDYNGNELEFSDISKGDIITAAMGNSICEIYADLVTVDSKVTSINLDSLESADGEYKRNYYSMANNSVSPAKTYRFFLDFFGNVADVDVSSESELKVFYLVKTAERKVSDDITLYAKFYALDGTFYEYVFADKVIIDKKPYKNMSQSQLAEEIGDTAVVDGSIAQPVSLEFKDGKISRLNTAKSRNELISNAEDGLCLRYLEKSRTYYDNSKTYGWEVYVDDQTPYMIVPADGTVTDEDSFKISSLENFEDTTTLSGYTFTRDAVMPDFVLIKKDVKTMSESFEGHDVLAVVEKVTTVLNEDGEEVKKMRIHKSTYSGEIEMDLYFDAQSTLTDDNGYSIHNVSKGDTIKVRWDEDKEIVVFMVYYKNDYVGNGSKYVYTGEEEGDFTTISQRKVTDILSGFMFVESMDGSIQELFNLSKYSNIIVVTNNGTSCMIKKGTPDDIAIGDYVINHIISRSVKTLVVYK